MMTTVLQRRTTYHAQMLDQHQVSSSLPWYDVLAAAHEADDAGGGSGRHGPDESRGTPPAAADGIAA